jgi:hypothetical protein
MTYAAVVELLQWAFRLFVIGLMVLVLLKLLIGTIPITGLLTDEPGGDIQPERMQALLSSLAIPIIYFGDCIGAFKGGQIPKSLPDVQTWMLAAGLGSHGLYLFGKILRR